MCNKHSSILFSPRLFVGILVSLFLSIPSAVQAQNKVVVIPMAGDTIVQEIDTFDRTIIVGGSGTAADNGDAILTALTLVDNPSATNPWLIWLEPGVFELASNEIELPAYVSLKGSGMDVTTITAAGTSSGNHPIELSGHNSVSDLTISDSSTGTSSGAIVPIGNDVLIRNVKVLTDDEDGIRIEVGVDRVLIENVIVVADDRAVSAQLSNLGITIRNSQLESTTDNTVNVGSSSSVVIDHAIINNTSTTKPVFNILANSDLTVRQSSISATGVNAGADLVNDAADATAELFLYLSHVEVVASFDFGSGTATCLAITTASTLAGSNYCVAPP